MTAADIVLLMLLAGSFVLGFLQGVIRQLLEIGAFLVAFVVAAHLRGPVGDWVSGQWTQLSPSYGAMLAFGGLFLAFFIPALVTIQFAGSSTELTRHALLDDALAGLLGLALGLLVLSGIVAILGSYYSDVRPAPANDISWIGSLHTALAGSAIGGGLGSSLVPGLVAILGPLLPSSVREVVV